MLFRCQLYHLFFQIVPVVFINEMASFLSLCKTVVSVTYIITTLITWANIFLGLYSSFLRNFSNCFFIPIHAWIHKQKWTKVKSNAVRQDYYKSKIK